MDEFILIFRHEDGLKVASQEQIQIWMQQTREWMGGIASRDKLSGGNGLLFADARVVCQITLLPKDLLVKIKKQLADIL